jgi:putative transposase
VPVNTSKENYKKLSEMRKESARLWNDCVKISEKYYKENKKWISIYELQKIAYGDNYNLLVSSGQILTHKFCFARNAAKMAKKTEKRIKYPYKEKKYFNVYWDKDNIKINYENGCIELAQKMIKDENGKRHFQKRIKCYSKSLPKNIVQLELIYKKGLIFSIVYKDETEYLQINSNNVASIDLGEIHSIAAIDNNQNVIIITGRKLREIKRFRNKKQAQLWRLMSKCQKYSKHWWKYQKALNYIIQKSKNQIKDIIHKMTKYFVDFTVLNNIKTVYVGELEGIQRNKKGKKSKLVNQKLSQFQFGEIIKYLEYKLKQYGIELIKVKEYYTSQICPNCKQLNKTNSRNYKCDCGYKQHRDIVGAINILNFNSNLDYEICTYKTKKYLQIA